MSEIQKIDLGFPALLEFRGPDAVRFLNGQLTQDVRRLAGGEISLFSCVTDAKGKLQFRVSLTEVDGALWVAGPADLDEELEARLTRYLIADDVEVTNLTGEFKLIHLTAEMDGLDGFVVRSINRFGIAGTDLWCPELSTVSFDISPLMGDELEAFRISNGVPLWGRELVEGILPPEALLEETDISYNKGCYIGQEVISRIKSAGKVNKRLARFTLDPQVEVSCGPLCDDDGRPSGELTSISPLVEDGVRQALGYVKRGAEQWYFEGADGTRSAVRRE
ncbi:MAG: hypothetical protein V4640_08300 [Verrucomicrobiota bacterium]